MALDFEYSYVPEEYKPSIGDARFSSAPSRTRASTHYANLPFLKELIDVIIKETIAIKEEASEALREYNLSIDPTSKLHAAQEQITGDSTTPDYVSFTEYEKVSQLNHRAASYVASEYEYSMRSAVGHNALDVYQIASVINDEARNIDTFITQYLGDMNDSSESRAVELFQDWARPTLEHTGALRYFLAQRDKTKNRLPNSELAQVNPDRARQYQALFQAKLNVVNKHFTQNLEAYKKENGALAKTFYSKIYGPAMYFRTRVMRHVEPTISSQVKRNILGDEIMTAQASLNSNLNGALTDQLRRNQLYEQRINSLFKLMQNRSAYTTYITQLSDKGSSLSNNFLPADKITIYQDVKYIGETFSEQDPWQSEHSQLDGVELDDAHPQYILRDGGSLLSDLWVADNVKIDGVHVSGHSHKGVDVDGTPQISGEDIEPGTIYDGLMSTNYSNDQPTGLQVANQAIRRNQGVVQIETTLAWEQSPDERFELNIVPLRAITPPTTTALGRITLQRPVLPAIASFTTEDSNFLSYVDSGTEQLCIIDANFNLRSIPIELPDAYPSTPDKLVLPFRTSFLGPQQSVVEWGDDALYVSARGITCQSLFTEDSVVLYETLPETYGDDEVNIQVTSMWKDDFTNRLYWFEVEYAIRNKTQMLRVVNHLKYMNYDTKEVVHVNSYLIFDGGFNETFLFLPLGVMAIGLDWILASFAKLDIPESGEWETHYTTPIDGKIYPTKMMVFSKQTGAVIDQYWDLDNGPNSFTIYEDKTLCTIGDRYASGLTWAPGYGPESVMDPEVTVYEVRVDEDFIPTLIPYGVDGLNSDERMLTTVEADSLGNLYGGSTIFDGGLPVSQEIQKITLVEL